MSETRTLHFSVQGEFITKLARERLFLEHAPYEQVEELLLSCMCGTDIPQVKLKYMAQDILLGRAALVGNSGDGTLTYQETNSYDNTVFETLDKLQQKNKQLEDDNTLFVNKYLDLYDVMQDNGSYLDCEFEDNQEVLKNYQKPAVAIYGQPKGILKKDWVDEVLETFEYEDNYGFIKPDGTFIPVEWANHLDWAKEHLKEMGWDADFWKWYEENIGKDHGDSGLECDFLVHTKGYILMHNPSQAMAFPTWNEVRMTKQQSEFLFDYYMKRNEPEKANIWLNIEENS